MNAPGGKPWPRFRPHENLPLKAVSLVLAIGVWAIVPDASVPHIVRNVPVRLRNIPAELALAEPFDTSLEVWVRGSVIRTRDLLPGELSPRLDLFGKSAGENTIIITPADIPTPLGVSVESIEPAQLHVVLEERVRVELPVNVVVEGSPAEGFEIIERTVEPARVSVTGPRSRIEQLSAVSTEAINVTGRREPMSRNVTVFTADPLITLEDAGRVRLTLQIEETPIVLDLDSVRVHIINADRHAVINPTEIGVVLSGPPSLIAELTAANIIATVDVGGLAPRAEDYRIEPHIAFDPPELGERISVLALRPQRRLDVHVFDRPADPAQR